MYMSFENLNSLIPLLIGGLSYLGVSRIFVGSKKQGGFSTLEHELTHAFFALLTFHKIGGIQTTATGGGVIQILGGSNWLILISPYFFPTISFLLMLLLILVGAQNQITSGFLLGFSIFYHFVSTKHELHRQQTDLIKVSFLFTLLFLPGANLFCYGILFTFSVSGVDGVINYLTLVYFTITSFL